MEFQTVFNSEGISSQDFEHLLNSLLTELKNSKAYAQAIVGLEGLVEEGSEMIKPLMQAVGREAISLTLQSLLESAKTASQVMSHTDSVASVTQRDIGDTKPRKITPEQQKAQYQNQQRTEILYRIGQTLQEAREIKSLSIEELHRRTLVPIHQIKALEANKVNELPEDVFVRSFIRQLGNALDLDGVAIANSLPQVPDTVTPSWYHSNSKHFALGACKSPLTLYLGYTALVAGAIGGLSLTLEQSPSSAVMETTPSETQVSASSQEQHITSELPSISGEISPPETMKN